MLYWFVRAIFIVIFATVFRWQVIGRANIPKQGPFLVCANHFSWLDPPLIGCVMPRQVFFMAKEELFQYPIFRELLLMVGAFPVKRGMPDRKALKHASKLLSEGRVVAMFVQGTRRQSLDAAAARPGAAWLAIRNRVPVLPVLIEGPYRPWRRIKISIGPAFELSEYYGRRAGAGELEAAGQEIMERITSMRIMSGDVETA